MKKQQIVSVRITDFQTSITDFQKGFTKETTKIGID
jgi:hypothetical protein